MIRKTSILAGIICGAVLCYAAPASAETYSECVARIKKDYPVPPGNINTQNQMIAMECSGLKTTKKK